MKKYYEILEVHPKASGEVIEKAYRVLAKKYHPDLYSGEKRLYAEKKMRNINEAYKILSDEFLREQYDLELEKEMQFDREDVDYTKKRRQNATVGRRQENTYKEYNEEKEIRNNNNVGTFTGILGVTKALFQNRPKFKNIRDIKREDYIAAGLTLLIMIILGVILWFIPATNGFVRSVLPFV